MSPFLYLYNGNNKSLPRRADVMIKEECVSALNKASYDYYWLPEAGNSYSTIHPACQDSDLATSLQWKLLFESSKDLSG